MVGEPLEASTRLPAPRLERPARTAGLRRAPAGMPATVCERWFIGAPELGAICLFAGIFLYVVFTALSKAPLLAKGNPFVKESEHFHY